MLKSGTEVRERQITIKIYYLIKSDDDIQSHLSLSLSLYEKNGGLELFAFANL